MSYAVIAQQILERLERQFLKAEFSNRLLEHNTSATNGLLFVEECSMATKNELLTLLDKHVFHPTLNARPNRYGEKQRKELRDLQRRTEEEKARFHGYDSAEHIVAVFREEIGSELARPMHARLKDLGLPAMPDVRDQFLRLAGSA
jgi:hypothetical protein